jgi:DNA topoisomerase-2
MRKDWLQTYNPLCCVDHNVKQLKFTDFINKELIHFSIADNQRSIPSVVDGLKPSQRKVLFSLFKRLPAGQQVLKPEIKVAQLAGYVAEHSAYHHGEMSLCSTIVNLA